MEQEDIGIAHFKEGQAGNIVTITGGRMVVKRLADLGLTPGTEIKLIRKIRPHGPVELQVRGSKIVLGRGIASKIRIKPK
jgi:Fe2+ transport system protein FeoA